MAVSNKTNITGDNIIALQNITARDINIGIKEGLNPDIKKAKEEIAEQIAELAQSVSLFANEKEFTDVSIIEEKYEGINFKELILAIKKGWCVLFLGPDIAVDKDQNSLHDLFFKRIGTKDYKYDETEGLFMPGSEGHLKLPALEYYGGTDMNSFQQQNIIGTNLIKKIVQIPFSLIVSLSPDDIIRRIFTKYNIKHKFLYYTGKKYNEEEQGIIEQPVVDGVLNTPIIYNALGNAAENGKFIYTHRQLNEYIKQNQDVKFPLMIETIIGEATHILFLGFNFNRWYYRLLLFDFNLLPKNEGHTGFALKSVPIIAKYQTFVHKQFMINFIDTNSQNFIDTLLHHSKENNLTKSLNKNFVSNTLNELEEIRIKAVDDDKLEQLTELRRQLDVIKGKVDQFK
jgi:hypothetical protein